MKSTIRALFASMCLVTGMIFAGCSSAPQGEFFLDNPQPRISSEPASPGGNTAAPANSPDVARFRVGDAVGVSYSGTPDKMDDHQETIKEDGTITLPLIGPIYCIGKTAGELQNEIHDDYVPKYYTRLTVTVLSGQRVYYVGGEVRSPGAQVYRDGITVTKAIESAGGMTDFANHSKLWVTRANGHRFRVDYDKALEDPSKDPVVYPNDQINVNKRIF